MDEKENITDYLIRQEKKKKHNLKYDFMPELLEIIEKPAHRGGKIIIWGIALLLLVALIWASVAKLDVVITAEVSIAPVDEIVCVQALESGYISEVCVENGQYVQRGDILIKENTEYVDVDISNIRRQMDRLNCENQIYELAMAGEDFSSVDVTIYEDALQKQIEYLISEETYYNSSLKDLEGESLEEERERHRIQLLGKIVANQEQMEALNAELEKANKNLENQTVKASVNGYVSNMTEGLLGTAVQTGSKLMEIVPENSGMQAIAYVSNADRAEVKKGMDVEVKLDAYPYSDYGTVKGKITYVSENSVTMEGVGNVYKIVIAIESEDENITLVSGLTGSVDIRIGKRSVLNYFLEPITGALSESMKEK